MMDEEKNRPLGGESGQQYTMSDYLVNMRHELRTSLNAIINFSGVLLKGVDGSLSEGQKQDLTTIYEAGQDLQKLLNDILDKARIDTRQMNLKLEYFAIDPVVEGVHAAAERLVHKKQKPITVQMQIADNIDPVYGDEFRTRQALLELVSYAVEFTRQGTVDIIVTSAFDRAYAMNMIRVDVIDSGGGIGKRDIPHLFQPRNSSIGLGLWIARALAELQDGQIDVISQIGQRTTFSLWLPTQPV